MRALVFILIASISLVHAQPPKSMDEMAKKAAVQKASPKPTAASDLVLDDTDYTAYIKCLDRIDYELPGVRYFTARTSEPLLISSSAISDDMMSVEVYTKDQYFIFPLPQKDVEALKAGNFLRRTLNLESNDSTGRHSRPIQVALTPYSQRRIHTPIKGDERARHGVAFEVRIVSSGKTEKPAEVWNNPSATVAEKLDLGSLTHQKDPFLRRRPTVAPDSGSLVGRETENSYGVPMLVTELERALHAAVIQGAKMNSRQADLIKALNACKDVPNKGFQAELATAITKIEKRDTMPVVGGLYYINPERSIVNRNNGLVGRRYNTTDISGSIVRMKIQSFEPWKYNEGNYGDTNLGVALGSGFVEKIGKDVPLKTGEIKEVRAYPDDLIPHHPLDPWFQR